MHGRGCCRRRRCRPARWRRRSGRRCRSGSRRCGRRTGSGSRRRCRRRGPGARCRGRRPRRRAPPRTPRRAQLPQSTRPVVRVSVRHAGWVCGSVAVGFIVEAILPRAVAAVVAEPQDVDVVAVAGVLILNDRLPDVDAHLRREALDRRSRRSRRPASRSADRPAARSRTRPGSSPGARRGRPRARGRSPGRRPARSRAGEPGAGGMPSDFSSIDGTAPREPKLQAPEVRNWA